MATGKQVISTSSAPQAIGPYSQAVVAGDFVFVSGQIPFIPGTTDFVSGGVSEQTEQVIRNLEAILVAAGSDLNRVVKTTVFLADMSDFAAMNEVYARFWGEESPARATVQAAALPRGALVEIEAVGLIQPK